MGLGVNKVMVIGNLGKDPEVRYSQTGSAVCSLRVAVGERKKTNGEWTDHTEWIPVTLFGKDAENAGQYLSKGSQVFVEGRMQTRNYKDKEGVEKWSTEVVCSNIRFLGSGKGKPERQHQPRGVDQREAPRGNGRDRGGDSFNYGANLDDGWGDNPNY